MTRIVEIATHYRKLGWYPIPIPIRSKAPLAGKWQELRIELESIPKYFQGHSNVGVLTGAVSKGLTDVDLDTPEAIRLAPLFLPDTMMFGRKSKPLSHWLFVAHGTRTCSFAIPGADGKKTTLLELRADGRQTVFPGSVHESGESIEWDPENAQEKPTEIKAEPLRMSAARLAVASALVRYGYGDEEAVALANSPRPVDDRVPAAVAELVFRWIGSEHLLPKKRNQERRAPGLELELAIDKWNNDHPINHQRRNSARCPMCDDSRSFGWLRDNDRKWSCFSTDHPDGAGIKSPGDSCFIGDSLDIESYHRGITRVQVLRNDGYIEDIRKPVPRPPATINAPSATVVVPVPIAPPPAPTTDEGRPPDDGDDDRPRVILTAEVHEVIDQVSDGLIPAVEVYQRGCRLVRVTSATRSPMHLEIFGPTPSIEPLQAATVTELISKYVQLIKVKETKTGKEFVRCIPPSWVVSGVMERASWRGIRPLEGIVEVPTFRADGTVLDVPGYDEKTGLIYQPAMKFTGIKPNPSIDDARASAQALLDVVCDFPFSKDGEGMYKSAWLAAVLTPFVRTSIPTSPAFLVDSNIRGSGKSKLCDIVSIIATGRMMPRTVNPEHDDEFKKLVTSLAIAGTTLIMIDNIYGSIGSPALDAAITAATWKDRILGKSEMTREIPLNTIWFATGNNVTLIGDLSRRTIHVLLNCEEENPETRSNFKHPDILEYVRKRRPELVAHAVTILRAYVCAGMPEQPMRSMDFKEWSRIVRGALIWAGQPDPGRTQEGLMTNDTDKNGLAMIIEALEHEYRLGNWSLSASQMLKLASEKGNDHELLREAINEICPSRDGKPSSAISLGKRLQHLKGRFIDRKCVDKIAETKSKGIFWGIKNAKHGQ